MKLIKHGLQGGGGGGAYPVYVPYIPIYIIIEKLKSPETILSELNTV